MSTPELERDVTTVDSTARPPSRSWRPLILRVHFYAGILVAPFILVAAISGGLYAIAPTLEQVLYRDYLHVDSTGPAAPVSEQVAAARAERPDLAVSAVRPAADAGDTTRVLFVDPSLGEAERLAVFIDPVSATSVGELPAYGSSGSLPVRTWISELHRTLHLGDVGRLYSELAASWLWVITLGGLYLWFERCRRIRSSAPAKARSVTVDRSSTGRVRTLNWHGVVGVWIAVTLIFLSATGLTWSAHAGENITDVRSSLSWTTPAITTAVGPTVGTTDDHGGHAEHGGHEASAGDGDVIDANVERLDGVLATARANDVTGSVEVSIPAAADTAFVVAQTRQPWVMSTDSIAVDGATDRVVDTVRFSDWPLAAKLSAWGIQLHMGTLFGVVNQLVLVAVALALVSVIARGYRMWWQRRPAAATGVTVARAPRRGGLGRLSPVAVAVLAVTTLAVGWFVPVLGLSLLAFVVLDLVLGAVGRSRRSTRT